MDDHVLRNHHQLINSSTIATGIWHLDTTLSLDFDLFVFVSKLSKRMLVVGPGRNFFLVISSYPQYKAEPLAETVALEEMTGAALASTGIFLPCLLVISTLQCIVL